MTVFEAINYAIENGIEQAQKQLEYWKKYQRLAKNNAKSLETSLLQLHETVEFNGYGKRGKVILGVKHSKVQKRDNKSGAQLKRKYSNLNERHLYDKEYAQLIRNFFERERLHQSFYDAWYKGIDSAKSFKKYMDSRDYNAESNSAYVYRFKSGGDIKYVGITNSIGARMLQHFTNGHLDKEMYDNVEKIEYIEVDSEAVMNLLEVYLINKWKPEWNTMRKYDGELSFGCIDDLIKEELWREYSYEE